MSPPPWRFKQVEVFPPPGMKNSTAPTVQADGHATLAPVAGLTQCPSFARSPRGGVAGGGGPVWGGGARGGPPPSRGGGGAPGGIFFVKLPVSFFGFVADVRPAGAPVRGGGGVGKSGPPA